MREELYDIRADIGEAHDLAAVAAHAATLRELRAELDSWLAATHARLPSPDPGEKTRSCAILTFKRSFYQDRLGTNIGKLKKEYVFSQGEMAVKIVGFTWQQYWVDRWNRFGNFCR